MNYEALKWLMLAKKIGLTKTIVSVKEVPQNKTWSFYIV